MTSGADRHAGEMATPRRLWEALCQVRERALFKMAQRGIEPGHLVAGAAPLARLA
jgi:hypothetical protein